MLALLVIEARLRDWRKIPFTCSYVAGRRNVWQTVAVYLVVFGAAIPIVSNAEHTCFGRYLDLRARSYWGWCTSLFAPPGEPTRDSFP